jgi:hypothetical protein
MALAAVLSAALLSATLTPAFAEDVTNDPVVVVDDPNTPVDESAEETTDDSTDETSQEPTEDGSEASEETPKGTPLEISMMIRGNAALKVFKKLDKKSIVTARNLAPKQNKSFHKTPAYAKWYAKLHIKERYGWSKKQFGYLAKLWGKESAWKYRSLGARNYYVGIPQLNKKAIWANGFSIKQFRKHPEIQIQLGAKYIKVRYGTPKHAWKHFLRRAWY